MKLSNFVYFCITREKALPHFHLVASRIHKDYIFHILQYIVTKLDNGMKFRILLPAVLVDFPNSKVCLIGEWSIPFARNIDFLFIASGSETIWFQIV